MKELDLNQSVYALISQYPEIKTIMVGLGFKDLENPAMLNTVGRYMTLPKGARLKKIPLPEIIATFEAQGFVIIGGPDGNQHSSTSEKNR
ncbi:DUF1858 domain-containing protein [Enterococcus canis]|uniref:DUF1858 domain-containing protein n=1 Tax=Enterococcus canis TaxID=214095 RepID=UPI0008328524|nr:DUF1858 domain-containing protein [Enterococcus canis]